MHDATVGFAPPPGAVWNEKHFTADRTGEPCDVIADNDLATYDTIYRNGTAVAIIDWDFAAPASRLWDIAHAAWSFTPLYPTQLAVRLVPLDEGTERSAPLWPLVASLTRRALRQDGAPL